MRPRKNSWQEVSCFSQASSCFSWALILSFLSYIRFFLRGMSYKKVFPGFVYISKWSTNCSTNVSNLNIGKWKGVNSAFSHYKNPKNKDGITPLHLTATKKSKKLNSLKKAAKWNTNSTSQDCCILTSVKFTKKSCQMKWSQSFFIFGIFLVRKSPRQSWPHFIWQSVNLTHLYCNLYSPFWFSH